MTNKSTNIREIFVIGAHRSGTTYLTNSLVARTNLFTPQATTHGGQIESAFFSSFLPYFRHAKTKNDNFCMQICFRQTDFFKTLNLIGNNSPKIEFTDCAPHQFFSEIMEAAAVKSGALGWIEKTPDHTLWLDYLLEAFPKARFVCVRRNLINACVSHLHRFGNQNSSLHWLKIAFWKSIYERVVARYNFCSNILIVSYEELVVANSSVWTDIGNFLELDVEPDLTSEYAPNSSFRGDRPEASRTQKLLIRGGWLMAQVVPGPLLMTFVRERRVKSRALPRGAFMYVVER